MALNPKDDYLDDVIKNINNIFIRKRLRRELSDHYDDSYSEEVRITPDEAGRMVRENMGEPNTITKEVNQNDTSILSRFFKHRHSILIFMLILTLISLGFTVYSQNLRQNQTDLLIKSLQNQVKSLSEEVDQHDLSIADTKTRLDAIDDSIQLIRNYTDVKYAIPGLYCCDHDYHTYNSTTNRTIITPPNIPLKIIVEGELPNYIKLFITKDSFAMVYDNEKTNQILFSWTMVSNVAATESITSPMNVNNLGNGFAVVRTFDISWILEGEDDELANQFIDNVLSIKVIK